MKLTKILNFELAQSRQKMLFDYMLMQILPPLFRHGIVLVEPDIRKFFKGYPALPYSDPVLKLLSYLGNFELEFLFRFTVNILADVAAIRVSSENDILAVQSAVLLAAFCHYESLLSIGIPFVGIALLEESIDLSPRKFEDVEGLFYFPVTCS